MATRHVIAGALAGAIIVPAGGVHALDGQDVLSAGVHLVFNFGQLLRVGLGFDLRYTHILDFQGTCDPRDAWVGVGAFGQMTWLFYDRVRLAAGFHAAAETEPNSWVFDAELGWSYTLERAWRGHGLQVGLTFGDFPIDLAIVRGNLSFADDGLRPEGQVGFGARVPGHFGGAGGICIIGRPLRVDGQTRLADFRVGPRASHPSPFRVADETRKALGSSWLEAARAEAASVPAFIALGRDLARVGAPRALINRAQSAARDEVRHARLCVALAGRAYGRSITTILPGVPPITRETRREALTRLALESWHDGCLGEATAARREALAFETCREGQSRDALGRIAHDEHTHGELAWSVLAFALAAGGSSVRESFAAALEVEPHTPPPDEETRGATTTDRHTWGRLGRLAPSDVYDAFEEVATRGRHRARALLDSGRV